MGRPLKIQKIIATGNPGVDNGYPSFNTLTNPVFPTTMTSSNFFGVVGGSNTVDTAAYPTVQVSVNIALPNGSGQGQNDGYIIRQKGAYKYLVASLAAVNDEEMVVGATYIITTLDTTNWQQMGAPAGATVGTMFTCTAVCANPQNGVGNLVGQCVLTSDLTPSTAGTMSISYAIGGDSTEVAVSKLTNKFLRNWDNFQNASGTSLTTYDSGGSNAGVVNYSGEDTYLANFFTDEGTAIKSGEASNGTITLAQVQKYNS